MTWLLPAALGVAVAAALASALLHLLARDRPPRWLLPTARFVAAGTARATRRARTPRDLLLLALRAIALVLAGAAFAGPVRHPEGGSIARLVVLDRTTASAEPGADIRAVRERLREGDRLVLLDSVASVVAPATELRALDSLAAHDSLGTSASGARRDVASWPAAGGAPLSAGLIAARRAAAGIPPAADSVALVIVSATLRRDAALDSVRASWPGRAEVVEVTPRRDTVRREGALRVRGPAGDALVAGARLAGARAAGSADAGGGALLVRGTPAAADSAFARAGGALVVWPPAAADAGGAAISRTAVGGFVAGSDVVVHAAARTHAPPAGRTIGRWIDGVPAITESPLGAGCVRTVAIEVANAGDLTLRPAFHRMLRGLLAPCAAAVDTTGSGALRAMLAGGGPLARAGALRRDSRRSPGTPWLLGAALALLLLEPLLRRTPARPAGEVAG